MSKWLLTSDGAFLFGQGGITRVEPFRDWVDGIKVCKGTQLYIGTTLIAKVENDYDDIIAQLWEIKL
jgi:hypothetical protein